MYVMLCYVMCCVVRGGIPRPVENFPRCLESTNLSRDSVIYSIRLYYIIVYIYIYIYIIINAQLYINIYIYIYIYVERERERERCMYM